jgi:hypothetical protein
MSESATTVLPAGGDPVRARSLGRLGLILGAHGVVLTLVGVLAEGGWSALGPGYLIAFAFCWAVVVGSLFFVALQHATKSVWSVVLRRVAEMLAAPTWLLALLFVPLLLFAFAGGGHGLFPWADAAHHDAALESKAPYLNETGFVIRGVLFLLVWVGFGALFVRSSLRQDAGRAGAGATARMRRASPIFLILFAFSVTFASFDWLMSLAPHWYSTIFGVYTFSGMTLTGLAAITLLAVWLRGSGGLPEGLVRPAHLYNLGALLFAFTCFWAYIAFSQYMLIWYANMPEETIYYFERWVPGWRGVTTLLPILRFGVPFLLLLSRGSKSDPKRLALASVVILLGQVVDLIWLVGPVSSPEGLRFGGAELGPLLVVVALLVLVLASFLRRHRIVAVGDPHLEQSRGFRI